MQLEAQIGHASEFVAARDTPTDNTGTTLHSVLDKLDSVATKLNCLQAVPASNSIVINSCQPDHKALKQKRTIMTQTELTSNEPSSEPTVLDETEEGNYELGDSQATGSPSL